MSRRVDPAWRREIPPGRNLRAERGAERNGSQVKITIDGKELVVDGGITVLEAARQNDIYIPTMYPTSTDNDTPLGDLNPDDKAAVTMLYPRSDTIVDAAYGNQDCVRYRDFRDVIARKDIDAIVISTPDHWHVALSLLGLQAGKHVFSEKPTLTVAQGRALVNAVKQSGLDVVGANQLLDLLV